MTEKSPSPACPKPDSGDDLPSASSSSSSSCPVEVETVVENDPSARSNKRAKLDVDTTATATTTDETPVDLADTLGYKVGDRMEVQWEINNEDDKEAPTTKTVWWKATLLEHDGKITDSDAVKIRSLLYDARPDLGFPEPSKEDVVFMSCDMLINPDDPEMQLRYKQEGLSEEENQVVQFTDEELEEQLNQILMGAFQNQQQAWKAMPAAAQAIIGEKMKEMKETIKQKLKSEAKKGQVITSETIQQLLAESF
ncbi:MAG: hypothetical protein SGILL_004012 [Bacillariaceae sp.]